MAHPWLQRVILGDTIVGDDDSLGALAVGTDVVKLLLIILNYRYGIQEWRLTYGAHRYSARNETEGECQTGPCVLTGIRNYTRYPLEATSNHFILESHAIQAQAIICAVRTFMGNK